MASHTAEASSLRSALRRDLFGIRGLTLARFGWTAVCLVLLSMWSTTANLLAEGDVVPGGRHLAMLAQFVFIQYGPWMFAVMIAVSVADALPLRGAGRVLALVTAIVLGALAGDCVVGMLECARKGCTLHAYASPVQWMQTRSGNYIWIFAQSSAFALAYFYRRGDQEVAEALHASEARRIAAERERVQAALDTMQARIDPAFLLGTLRDVGTRCESDTAGGTRVLDLLIRYLRAALPGVRRVGSRFEREGDLLRTFLEICALRSNGALQVSWQFDESLRDAAFPPMVLLPLVAATVAPSLAGGTIGVDARVIDGRIRVAVSARGAAAGRLAGAPAVGEVRERLHSLHGERASFVVDNPGNGEFKAILEIPNERANGTDR